MIEESRKQKMMNVLAKYFYLINLVGYVYAALHPSFRIGMLTGALIAVMMVLAILQLRFDYRYTWALLIIGYSLFTIIPCLIFGYPIFLYIRGILYNLFPISFFFIRVTDLKKLYRWIFEAIFLSLIAGYAFYIYVPDSYVQFLYSAGHIGGLYKDLANVNMQGLFGLTITGSFSCCCAIYFFSQWIVNKKWLDFIQMAVSLYMLFMAGRRSSMAASIILILLANIIYYKEFKTIRGRQFIIITIILILAVLFMSSIIATILPVLDRILNISGAVSERSWNWKYNISQLNWFSWIFGKGIGTSGHMATQYGTMGVHDNSYLLYIMEEGILGFSIFLIMVINQVVNFVKKSNKILEEYISLFIVIVFFIQATGSNVWEFPILSVLFWLSLSNCNTIYSETDNVLRLYE